MLEHLRSLGAEEKKQIVQIYERSGEPIEILVSNQWFLKSLNYRNKITELSNSLHWCPKSMQIKLMNWVDNLSSDWYISRQRYLGVPMPVWRKNRNPLGLDTTQVGRSTACSNMFEPMLNNLLLASLGKGPKTFLAVSYTFATNLGSDSLVKAPLKTKQQECYGATQNPQPWVCRPALFGSPRRNSAPGSGKPATVTPANPNGLFGKPTRKGSLRT